MPLYFYRNFSTLPMGKLASQYDFKLVLVGNFSLIEKDFFENNHIFICDDPLEGYNSNGCALYYRDYHPNALGHQVIADGIYDCLKNSQIISSVYRKP